MYQAATRYSRSGSYGQVVEQVLGGVRHTADSSGENGLIRLGGLSEPGHLPNVLERRLLHRRPIEHFGPFAQSLDASAHGCTLCRAPRLSARPPCPWLFAIGLIAVWPGAPAPGHRVRALSSSGVRVLFGPEPPPHGGAALRAALCSTARPPSRRVRRVRPLVPQFARYGLRCASTRHRHGS